MNAGYKLSLGYIFSARVPWNARGRGGTAVVIARNHCDGEKRDAVGLFTVERDCTIAEILFNDLLCHRCLLAELVQWISFFFFFFYPTTL